MQNTMNKPRATHFFWCGGAMIVRVDRGTNRGDEAYDIAYYMRCGDPGASLEQDIENTKDWGNTFPWTVGTRLYDEGYMRSCNAMSLI